MKADKKQIECFVDAKVDRMFGLTSELYGLKHGDISPEQVDELDDIKKKLSRILRGFVKQNQH